MTFLQHVGNFFKGIFADVTHVAVAVEPVVDLAFPGIAPLYNATVQAVSVAEAAGTAAAGATTGNGAAKLAYLRQNGIQADSTHIQAWINAVVATLNALPAPSAAVTAASGANPTVAGSTIAAPAVQQWSPVAQR
jgi:membrane-associated protease RseP (regulator of RpoE activity)